VAEPFELTTEMCALLFREHCHYWYSSATVLHERARELLEIIGYRDFMLGRQASITAAKLKATEEVLRAACETLHEFQDDANAGAAIWIPSAKRLQVHMLSELLHHLDASIHQTTGPIDYPAEVGGWPTSAAGAWSVTSAFESLLRDNVRALTPQGTSALQLGLRAPIARSRWIVRYNFYPKSGTACFPAGDLFRLRMWALLAHEYGHAYFGLSRPRPSATADYWIKSDILRNRLYKTVESMYHEILAALGVTEQIELSIEEIATHCEEYIADQFGAHVTGLAYLHAFVTFVGGDGDGPGMKEVDSLDARVRWLARNTHPPAIIRQQLIARTVADAGGISGRSETVFVKSLLAGVHCEDHHRTVARISQRYVPELAATARDLVRRIAPGSKITQEHYDSARLLLAATPMSVIAAQPDCRTILLAAAMKRLHQGGPSGWGGSLLTAVTRLLNAKELV
jgi:hypothetical protein